MASFYSNQLIAGAFGGTFEIRFTWDENKRALNQVKHGLDSLDARELFDARSVVTFASPRGDEARLVSVGLLRGRMVAVVWLVRDGDTRLISLRSARSGEKGKYRQIHG